MSELAANHRANIEDAIGRPLSESELASVANLNALSECQVQLARTLASRQLVLCTLYLRAVADARLPDIQVFLASASR